MNQRAYTARFPPSMYLIHQCNESLMPGISIKYARQDQTQQLAKQRPRILLESKMVNHMLYDIGTFAVHHRILHL